METRCKLAVTNKLNLVLTKNCVKETNALDIIMKNNPSACACKSLDNIQPACHHFLILRD